MRDKKGPVNSPGLGNAERDKVTSVYMRDGKMEESEQWEASKFVPFTQY